MQISKHMPSKEQAISTLKRDGVDGYTVSPDACSLCHKHVLCWKMVCVWGTSLGEMTLDLRLSPCLLCDPRITSELGW